MTRKEVVIASTTGVVLFLVSIPWFLLVKNHLMLEPPYFRVDASYQAAASTAPQVAASSTHAVLSTSTAADARPRTTVAPGGVSLTNLPASRVAALTNVRPSSTSDVTAQPIASPETPSTPVPAPAKVAVPEQEEPEPVVSNTVAASPKPERAAEIKVAKPKATPSTRPRTTLYGVQVAAFANRRAARTFGRTYEVTGTEVHIVEKRVRGKLWYRVVLGGSKDKEGARQTDRILQQLRGGVETQVVAFEVDLEAAGETR